MLVKYEADMKCLRYRKWCVIAIRNMSQVNSRGAMIVVEGGDKCGKTTHCTKLVEALKQEGKKVEIVKFPDRGTATGRVISDYLSKKEDVSGHVIHLVFAANRWEAMPQMKKKLLEGTTLVVDRYSYSGVAYSLAKQIEGLDMKWCWQPEVGLLKPDAVLLLTTSQATAAKRQVQIPERFEDEDSFQEHVLAHFRMMKNATWTEFDTSRDIDEVHAEIKAVVNQVLLNIPPAIEYLR